jgi:N-methylhydantoinase B/oxoprolinase/acetone carboxylase alpha subunit
MIYKNGFFKGCMRPIEVVLPPGSLLDPHKDAAVVGK